MKHSRKKNERGIALIAALLALLMIMALAAGLAMITGTETGINSNYQSEQVLVSGAAAGIEEARDRLMVSSASPLTPCTPASAWIRIRAMSSRREVPSFSKPATVRTFSIMNASLE
jgi:Tfp pilus assembly protein PilX